MGTSTGFVFKEPSKGPPRTHPMLPVGSILTPREKEPAHSGPGTNADSHCSRAQKDFIIGMGANSDEMRYP